MINSIIEAIRPILTSLSIIDIHAGLVKTTTRKTVSDSGTITEIFPISCTANIPCEIEGYQIVVPDERYKSLSYFEINGPMKLIKIDRHGSQFREYSIIQDLSFVFWANLKKFGIDTCNTEKFKLVLIEFFTNKFQIQTSYSIRNFNILVVSVTDDNVFSRYSYKFKENLGISPFNAFKIDIQLSFSVDLNCIQDITFNPETEC